MHKSSIFHLYKFNEYRSFLKECTSKQIDSNIVLHKHHVYPRFLKLEEPWLKDVIVRITVEDHIKAHMMLSECYEPGSSEYLANLRSARLLSKNSIEYRDELNKIYEYQRGDNNPSKLPENKLKISTGLKNYYKDRDSKKKGKTYKEIYGDRYQEEINKRKKSTRNKYEYKTSAKKALLTKIKNNSIATADKHSWAIPLIIDGVYYPCMRIACEMLGISKYKIKKMANVVYVKNNKGNRSASIKGNQI